MGNPETQSLKEILTAMRAAEAEVLSAQRAQDDSRVRTAMAVWETAFLRYCRAFRGAAPTCEERSRWATEADLPADMDSFVRDVLSGRSSVRAALWNHDAVARDFFEMLCRWKDDPGVVRKMLARSRPMADLFSATMRGNTREIERLIEAGEDPNVQVSDFDNDPAACYEPGGRVDYTGGASLHMAAMFGLDGPIRTLVRHGANPNIRNGHGGTPAHVAAGVGAIAAVRALLLSGADPDAYDRRGATPLLDAVAGNAVAVVDMLLSAGADPHVTAFGGVTAFRLAAMRGNEEVIALLQGRRGARRRK